MAISTYTHSSAGKVLSMSAAIAESNLKDALHLFSKLLKNIKENHSNVDKTLVELAELTPDEHLSILLADDDADDRYFFKEAIDELHVNVNVNTVADGIELMNFLDATDELPDILFLDINMPLKNGHECLKEIKSNDRFKDILVIIYSTSSQRDQVESTYREGANFYIKKPDSFSDLKLLVTKVLSLKPIDFINRLGRDNYFLNLTIK